MNILLVSHFFPPRRNAGTENYTLGLAKSLQSRGNDVHVLCAEDWDTGDSFWNGVTKDIYEGIPVYRTHLNWKEADNPNQILYDNCVVESWLDGFLSEQRPDIVHITSAVTLGAGTFRSVQRAGIPLVLTLTDFWFICPRIQLVRGDGALCDGRKTAQECQSCLSTDSGIIQILNGILPKAFRLRFWEQLSRYPWLAKKRGFRGILLNVIERKQILAQALSIPDRIFAPSKFVQQVFINNTSAKVEVLHHGHDLSWLKRFNSKTLSGVLRIGYIGQIQEIKGVHVLIEAFQIANLDGQACLDIWGDYSTNPNFAHRLKILVGNSPSITLHGRFDRGRLAEVLANIDVLVIPSLWYENAPLVIQESFAAGIPVVATNLGGMAEMVSHDENGLLFERGNADDLAKQLQRLINEPGLIERLKAGIPKVKTSEEEVDELEKIYFELVHDKLKVKETKKDS